VTPAALRLLTTLALVLILTAGLMFAGTVFGSVRAQSFTVRSVAAPQPQITVHLSATQSCLADRQTFDLVNGVSVLTIVGMVCAGDAIFRNGFEAATAFASSQPLWPRLAHRGPGEWAGDVLAATDADAIARAVAAEPRVDGTRMDGKATFMRRAGNGAAQLRSRA
jgi:hypothetical protein